ncbi:MAG TPA: DUF255 domain-containing protein, partial [Planctomycetota bacterium]|nr:DUF255 domain-containing protein [Planctomycetota bacterium]
SWCRFCRELDETTFAHPEVVRLVEERYVPVRVDKDRRPELNARYNCGGWPTVAFLTPDADLIAGETFITAPEIIPVLQRVAPFFHEHREEIHARVTELADLRLRSQERRESGPISGSIVDEVGGAILESFDPVHGGFGTGSKFPHPEALEFAMAQYARHGDERMREVVVKTLDAMARGEIHDGVEGGFFRYAQARDWRAPHTEKVLDSNAARLSFYLQAYQLFGTPAYRDVAAGILSWLESRMLDSETGCFFGSQDADPQYYGLPIERRRLRSAPRVDRTIYADWNAITASSLLLASTVSGEAPQRERLRDEALRTLEFLLEEMFDEKRGFFHYWDGTFHLPGLLSDQAYGLRALTDALAHTGDTRFLRAAEKLASVVRSRHLSSTGGFYDLPHDGGDAAIAGRRNRSILENSVIAEALIRLGLLLRDDPSRRDSWRATAREALEAFTSDYRQYGYYAAGYARAVDLLLHEPLHVTVVGPIADPRAAALRLAALSQYVPNRVVDPIDPSRDRDRLERAKLPVPSVPTAFINVGRTSYAEVTDPDELPSVLTMAERDRAG